MNELSNVSNLLQPILFTDETTVSLCGKDFDYLNYNLNIELNKIQQWTVSNRLSINANKSELLLITKRLVDCNQSSVILGQHRLVLSNYCRFLGVSVGENLTFSKHIRKVLSKSAKMQKFYVG